jgi:nitrogen-specific signal transduction histidine kinase
MRRSGLKIAFLPGRIAVMRWSDSSAVKGGLPVSRRPAFKEKNSREDQQAPAFTPLLIELVHRIRGSFSTLKGLAEISRDKFREKNYGEYYTRVVTEEIARTESVLACFIDYLRINTPLQKQNTVHKLIEQALRRNDLALQEKRIRVTRKFESDIPETAVHDDQLRISSAPSFSTPSRLPHSREPSVF